MPDGVARFLALHVRARFRRWLHCLVRFHRTYTIADEDGRIYWFGCWDCGRVFWKR